CDLKHFRDKSAAAFSEVTWRPGERLELIAGGRVTHDEIITQLATFGPIYPTPYALKNTALGDESFNDFSPNAGIVLKQTDALRYYLTISKGYKAGGSSLGFNASPATVPLPAIIDVPFKPENLWSYEAGVKSEWLDHRLRVNASAFDLEWKDLQM